MRRPRLSASDLEIIVKALDLYICDLEERTPAEEEKKINESVLDFMNSPRYLLRKNLLTAAENARAVKVQVLRNLKGMWSGHMNPMPTSSTTQRIRFKNTLQNRKKAL